MNNSPNGTAKAESDPLTVPDRGAQYVCDWWAPSPVLYKEGEGAGHDTQGSPLQPLSTVPTDLGQRSADGKHRQDLAPPPRRPPSLDSAGGGRRGTATRANHRRCRTASSSIRTSPTPTSSPPSSTPSTRWHPPAPARLPRRRPTVCVLLSPSFPLY